jgi:thermitase
MPVKVMDSDGAGSFSSVANGIVWATDHGARVISMSLGFTSSSSTLQSAVQYAHNRNVVLVAAAGNAATSAPVFPAAYPEVLGVAGTDTLDQLYSWSSYGSWVKLAAPGCNYTTGRNSWYGPFCGTSSAAPALAGVAGLLASYAPLATNTQIEQALERSAAPIGTQVTYGRVDAYQSLLSLGAPVTGTAPVNTALPTVSGTAQEGKTLAASNGSWSGSPTGYAYQWRRCDAAGANCADLAGATGATYATVTGDVGSTLRVAVTATNTYGSAGSASAATAVVSAAPTTATATFTGTLNGKQPRQTYKVTVGAGATKAGLSFSKASSLTLTVLDVNGKPIGTASGPSVLALVQTLAAGTYSFQVSGAPKSGCGFTLTISYSL